jgi:Tol biopolymer transport system component
MPNPPKSVLFLLLFIVAALSGCTAYWKGGPPKANLSPLVIDSAPDMRLDDPTFEEPSSVVAWARPVAPESSMNSQFTPDGQHLVYLATHPGTSIYSLYTVPLAGGAPIELSRGHAPEEFFYPTITVDSSRVIYYTWSGRRGLYSVALDGTKEMQLAGDRIHEVALSPDGQWVVYWGEEEQGEDALYSVPVAGGPPLQLNGPLGEGESVLNFSISPDGERVFYTQGLRNQETLPLYAVPITGGDPVTLPTFGWFQQSADGRWLVYGVRLETPGFDIYIVPTEGGAPVKINGPVPTNSAVARVVISPDSRTVFYATSKDAGGGMPVFDGLYAVPITGGEAREITGVDGRDRVFGFFFAPDGQTLLADVDYDGDGYYALYAFTPEPPPAPQ